MTQSNRFDSLANAYKINAFVINVLNNKCISLNAQIDLIYWQSGAEKSTLTKVLLLRCAFIPLKLLGTSSAKLVETHQGESIIIKRLTQECNNAVMMRTERTTV